MLDLDQIKIWNDNYNSNDIAAIARSIRRFGMNNAPRLWRDYEVRGGNHTVKALRLIRSEGPRPELDKAFPPGNVIVKDGKWFIKDYVDISHLDPMEANAFAIADNQLARNAVVDDQKLFAYLQNISVDPIMFDATGFSEKAFEELRLISEKLDGDKKKPSAGDAGPTKSELRLEELQAKWGVEPGDVWIIPSKEGQGVHRLICGDCREPAVMKKLIATPVQIVFTSPPYAEQRKDEYASIPPDEYVEWWSKLQATIKPHLVEGGSFFVNIKPHCEDGERVLYVFDLVIAMRRQWGWRFVDEFSWNRVTAPGRWDNRFKNGFEPVYQFQNGSKGGKFHPDRVGYLSDAVMVSAKKSGGAKETASTGTYYNISDQTEAGLAIPSNVISVSGIESGIPHPAQYPVGLPEHFIKVFTDPGDRILDPFMGGGTTFVAAENTGRIAYGSEVSPAYCAAILQRLQDKGLSPERAN